MCGGGAGALLGNEGLSIRRKTITGSRSDSKSIKKMPQGWSRGQRRSWLTALILTALAGSRPNFSFALESDILDVFGVDRPVEFVSQIIDSSEQSRLMPQMSGAVAVTLSPEAVPSRL